jgi:hypothetical protein
MPRRATCEPRALVCWTPKRPMASKVRPRHRNLSGCGHAESLQLEARLMCIQRKAAAFQVMASIPMTGSAQAPCITRLRRSHPGELRSPRLDFSKLLARQLIASLPTRMSAQPMRAPGSIRTQVIDQDHRSPTVPPVAFLREPTTVCPSCFDAEAERAGVRQHFCCGPGHIVERHAE